MSRSRRALILLGIWLVGGLAALPPSVAAQSPPASPAPQKDRLAPGTPPASPAPKQERLAPGTPSAAPAPPQTLRAEPLRPAPQTIRQKWGIWVFLAWLWFTTGALLYLLRRLVRESDRVHGLGYATPEPTPPKKNEPRF